MTEEQDKSSVTLGVFLLDCLKKEGIREIFGIPGDYNFTLLDALERYEGIDFINGRNELNAGYAADGYARIKGMAALITTFGVGELSACNAIAGSYSESVPVIHIVGSPKSMLQQEHKLLHHTLHDGNYDAFRQVYEPISAYTAVVTPQNAAIEIPAAIRIAKERKKPVYLVVAIDQVTQPIVPRSFQPEDKQTNASSLEAATAHARRLLDNAKSAVILADHPVQRYGLGPQVQKLSEAMQIPTASMMLGKSSLDESHANYIGIYGGAFGSQEVSAVVEEADCVLAVGVVWSDSNTANFTAKLESSRMIRIQPDHVQIGEAAYRNIKAEDMLSALQAVGFQPKAGIPQVSFPYDTVTGGADEPLTSASYYPRFQRMLKQDDIVVVDTGTLTYGLSQVRLPQGVDYIAQAGWESIGYATPAAFGASVAGGQRRVLLFTGEGALQLTVQEISSLLAGGYHPIIFVLNNNGYTIEKYLNVKTRNQKYNEIPQWSYTKLVEAFGGDAYTVQVRTNGELDDAIEEAARRNAESMSIIELITDPMDAPAYLHKMREYLKTQENQQS